MYSNPRLARGVRDGMQLQDKHSSVLAVPPGHGRVTTTNSRRRSDITMPGRRHLGRLTWRAEPGTPGPLDSTDVDIDNLVHPEPYFFVLAVVLSYTFLIDSVAFSARLRGQSRRP